MELESVTLFYLLTGCNNEAIEYNICNIQLNLVEFGKNMSGSEILVVVAAIPFVRGKINPEFARFFNKGRLN